MPADHLELTPELLAYVEAVSLREPALLAELRAETAPLEMAVMQISAIQGQFMALLVRLLGARRCLEIGVFTGYSSLAVALALPPDGQLVALDVSADWTATARRYWEKAGVANKIELRLAPALESLDGLLSEGAAGSFDFAFIDADKGNYPGYFERALELLRPGGLIAIDNTLFHGQVLPGADLSALSAEGQNSARAIAAFNQRLKDDDRVVLSMLPLRDGLTLALKR